jgi:hypothetical protein
MSSPAESFDFFAFFFLFLAYYLRFSFAYASGSFLSTFFLDLYFVVD